MRKVMTRVFPEPAPARINTGPSRWSTASRCSGFSLSRKSMGGVHYTTPYVAALARSSAPARDSGLGVRAHAGDRDSGLGVRGSGQTRDSGLRARDAGLGA